MITLRLTQKLRKYLGIIPVNIPEPPTAVLGDWYGYQDHLFWGLANDLGDQFWGG
jgi:hypothetical protein